MKKNGIFGLLVILLVLGFIGCGGENDPEIFTVTIGTLINANGSTIIASPTSGVEGTEIILTINEDNTYRLKSGTLKYGEIAINETTLKFNLPSNNIIVTAEFESFFIGSWKYDEEHIEIFSFIKDGIFTLEQKRNDVVCYVGKGTWLPKDNFTIILTLTHYKFYQGYTTIDDFNQNDIWVGDPIIIEFEIYSNNTIKTDDFIFTIINNSPASMQATS